MKIRYSYYLRQELQVVAHCKGVNLKNYVKALQSYPLNLIGLDHNRVEGEDQWALVEFKGNNSKGPYTPLMIIADGGHHYLNFNVNAYVDYLKRTNQL